MNEQAWERIGKGVWLKRFPLKMLGTRMGRSVTVFQLSDENVLIHSTGLFGDDDKAFLERLGGRIHIVEATCFHDTLTKKTLDGHSGAAYYAPAGFPVRNERIRPIEDVGSILPESLTMIPIGGMPKVNEVAFHDSENGILVVSDLLFNFGPETDAWTKFFFRIASGIKAYPGMSRLFRALIKDREAFQASVDRLKSLDFQHLIVAHGDPVFNDGKAALELGLERHGF